MGSLIFPQWDMVGSTQALCGINHSLHLQVTVILCVFLLSYMYGEGKVSDAEASNLFSSRPQLKYLQSNYFKGSILVLTYLVVVVGFYLAGYASDMELMGIDRFDTLAIGHDSFKTIGRGRSGRAY